MWQLADFCDLEKNANIVADVHVAVREASHDSIVSECYNGGCFGLFEGSAPLGRKAAKDIRTLVAQVDLVNDKDTKRQIRNLLLDAVDAVEDFAANTCAVLTSNPTHTRIPWWTALRKAWSLTFCNQ